jgi:hypothetical protein
MKPHSLQEAFKEYVAPEGFEGAHSAPNDVHATTAVFLGQLKTYPNLPRTVKELSEYCFPNKSPGLDRAGKLKWSGADAVLTFGKWKNTPLHLVDVSYLQWCMGASFEEDFKLIIAEAIVGNYPGQPKKQLPLEEQPF